MFFDVGFPSELVSSEIQFIGPACSALSYFLRTNVREHRTVILLYFFAEHFRRFPLRDARLNRADENGTVLHNVIVLSKSIILSPNISSIDRSIKLAESDTRSNKSTQNVICRLQYIYVLHCFSNFIIKNSDFKFVFNMFLVLSKRDYYYHWKIQKFLQKHFLIQS